MPTIPRPRVVTGSSDLESEDLPEQVTIHVTQSGWGFREASLTLSRAGDAFSDGVRRIRPSLVSALVEAGLAGLVIGIMFLFVAKEIDPERRWLGRASRL